MTLKIGTAILGGKYRIDRVLGVGGMAVVYQVTHLDFGRTFALKRLHPELAPDARMRARLLQEGRVAALLHSGAVEIFDWQTDDDGSPVLVMELLDGASADALSADGANPMPLRECLYLVYLLLDVLHAAHARGIVHRDIKPANLFVLRDGRLKVLDFGISQLRDAAAGTGAKTTTGVIGTPAFMAPEQARGELEQVDQRTDLFGVGATLFSLISGQQLHRGSNARQVVNHAGTEPARSLMSVDPHVPLCVVDLVARAVAFNQAERWPSAAAMREAIAEIHERLFGAWQPAELATLVERNLAAVGAEQPACGPRHGSQPDPLCTTEATTEAVDSSCAPRAIGVELGATQRSPNVQSERADLESSERSASASLIEPVGRSATQVRSRGRSLLALAASFLGVLALARFWFATPTRSPEAVVRTIAPPIVPSPRLIETKDPPLHAATLTEPAQAASARITPARSSRPTKARSAWHGGFNAPAPLPWTP